MSLPGHKFLMLPLLKYCIEIAIMGSKKFIMGSKIFLETPYHLDWIKGLGLRVWVTNPRKAAEKT